MISHDENLLSSCDEVYKVENKKLLRFSMNKIKNENLLLLFQQDLSHLDSQENLLQILKENQ